MKAHIARNQNAGVPLALGWNLSPADRGKLEGMAPAFGMKLLPVAPADAGKTVAQLLGEVEVKAPRTLVLEPGAYPPALVLANFRDKDVDTLLICISQLLDGMEADIPWYDFKNGTTGGYKKMQGDKDCIVIAEGIHMLNPLIFDKLRGIANGVYVAPRTRIITNDDKIVRPEQLRVARRLIRDYNTRGHSLQDTVERAESVDRGEVNYIMPYKSNAAIHIDTFHDYEPCILAKYLNEIPQFRQELTPEYLEKHGLTDLMKVVGGVPPLHTAYVPRNSIVREFVGGSCYQY